MNRLRKICLIVIGSYISCSVFSQQSLPFDSSFIQNSTAWKMKYKGGKKKFPKMIYDSLQLIYTNRDSSVPILKMYGHVLPMLEEVGHIENLYLRYVYNYTDTVLAKATVRNELNELKQTWWEDLIFGNNKENAGTYSYVSSAGFIFLEDNVVWDYHLKKSETDNWFLTNMADSIFIQSGSNKQGIIFYFKGKPVAMDRKEKNENIRILKDLPRDIKKILAVFIATTFCYRDVLSLY